MPDKTTTPRSRSRSPVRRSTRSNQDTRPTIGEGNTSGPSRRSASPDRAGPGNRSSDSHAQPPTSAVPTSPVQRLHFDGVSYHPFSVMLPRWRAPDPAIPGDTRRDNHVRFDGLPSILGNSSSDTPADSSSHWRLPDTAPATAPIEPARMTGREQLRQFRIERDARLAAAAAGSSSTSTVPPRPSTRTARPASTNPPARNSSNPPRLPVPPEPPMPGTLAWLFAQQADANSNSAAPAPLLPRPESAPPPRTAPVLPPPPNPAFFTPWPMTHAPMHTNLTVAYHPERPRVMPPLRGVIVPALHTMGPFGPVGGEPQPNPPTIPHDRSAGQAGWDPNGPGNGRPQAYYHFIHVNFDYATAPYPNPGIARELVGCLTDVNKGVMRELNEKMKLESNIPEGEEEEKWTCGICLDHVEGLDEGKESESSGIRETPCEHLFHGKCLETWFKTSYTCPLCRKDLEYIVNPEPELEAPGSNEGPGNSGREPSSDLSDDEWQL